MYIDHNGHITQWFTIMGGQQLLTLHWCSFSTWGRVRFTFSFAYQGSQYSVYDYIQPVALQITQDTWPTILDAPLTPIFMMGHASETTLISVWNTQVFRMALTAPTEPRMLWRRITRYPSPRRRVALHTYLLYFVVSYTHHQNDTCVTLFAGAAVTLKPFTQRLAIDDKPGSTSNHSHVFSLYSHLCIYVSI